MCDLHRLVDVCRRERGERREKGEEVREREGSGERGEDVRGRGRDLLASLKTIKGLFPPSSKVTRFKLLFAEAR